MEARIRPAWRFTATLGLIACLAFALRAIGCAHGLDLHDDRLAVWHTQNDEETQATAVRDRHLAGEFDPGACWLWGSGGFQVYGILDRLSLPLLMRSQDVLEAQRADALARNLSWMLLSHRLWASLAATLAVVVLGLSLRSLVSERVGLMSAVFLATAYLATRESHYGTFDQWILLGAVIALRGALALALRPAMRALLIHAFLCGVFASFKYSGIALLAIVGLGWLFGTIAGRRELRLPWLAGSLVVETLRASIASLVVAAAGYLLLSPTLVSSFPEALAAFRSQQGLIGFQLATLPEIVRYHLCESLWIGAGETFAIAAAFGFLLSLVRPLSRLPRGLAVLLAVAACVFPLSNTSHSVRQALPCFPFLALLAALAVDHLARVVRWRGAIVALTIVVCAPSLVRSIALDRLLTQRDTRQDGLRYFVENGVRPEDAIGIGFYGLPRTSLTLRRAPFLDWLDAVYRRQAVPRSAAATLAPKWIVRDRMAGVDDSFGWDDFATRVAAEYEVVLEVEGRKPGVALPLPDLAHGTPFHFIPFAAPWQMTRPGPAYVIYRRKSEG